MDAPLKSRDPKLSKLIAQKIHEAGIRQPIKICHVCGTHEWTITHYGIRSLLPRNVEVIAGPGCPVCIIPASEIDAAMQLANEKITITCFGDVLRVPGSEGSLSDAKANGADVRVVYSVDDAVKMARNETDKDFVFFAVGFETTAPSTAVRVTSTPPKNLSFLISHRVIPPAMEMLVQMKDLNIDGFIAPGHVSTIIGIKPYRIFPETYKMPTVVAGFEPLDVLFGIYMIVKQIKEGKPRLENEYVRAVTDDGNIKAQKAMHKAFESEEGNWRGLGKIPSSKLVIRPEYGASDAVLRHNVKIENGIDIRGGCHCHLIVIGKIKPEECPLFMKTCTPQKPVGACMVSSEGTCRVWARNITTT